MHEGTGSRLVTALKQLGRVSREGTSAISELNRTLRGLRRLHHVYSTSRHKQLVKDRNRAANKVAGRSRRVNRMRAR